jgi:hypothetical protein
MAETFLCGRSDSAGNLADEIQWNDQREQDDDEPVFERCACLHGRDDACGIDVGHHDKPGRSEHLPEVP